MTDPIDVSISIQMVGSTAAPAPSAALAPAPSKATGPSTATYAFAQCEQITINDTAVLLVNVRSGGKLAVMRSVASALTYCLHYETLADHAKTLCATLPALRDQQAEVLQVLESARDAGILLSAQDTAARLGTAAAPQRLPPTRVFVITCDRPAAIERLLDSLLSAGDLSRHDRLVLIDDSRQPDNIQRNRELVSRFNRSSAKEMQYVGAQAADELLRQLLLALPEYEGGLRFLLDRQRWTDQPTYGLARNLALLLSVGYRAVMLDDDIVCRGLQPPRREQGIGFRHKEAREAWFYPTVPALVESTRPCTFNPLTRHAEVVGQSLATVLRTLTGGDLAPGALTHSHGKMLGVLEGSSPVIMTQCGSAGDPGTVGSKWVARLGVESVRRLLAQSADNQSIPPSRPCWLGYTQPTIALRGEMSQMTGLDNSQLLPPYLPVLRGEDTLFAGMTAFLHPHSAVLNFEWAVLHLPLEDRSAADYDKPFTNEVSLGLLANYLLSRIDSRGSGGAPSRLSALAAEIRGLAEWPADTLRSQVGVELAKDCAIGIGIVERQRADTQNAGHDAWRAFLERYAAQLWAALMAPVQDQPDWVGPLRAAAMEFAQGLEGWARIREQSAVVAASLFESERLQP